MNVTEPETEHTQVEALFDLPEPHPVTRAGTRQQLAALADLPYNDHAGHHYRFWALAPVPKEWVGRYATTLEPVEHVWLIDGNRGRIVQAQIVRATGNITRRRDWKPPTT